MRDKVDRGFRGVYNRHEQLELRCHRANDFGATHLIRFQAAAMTRFRRARGSCTDFAIRKTHGSTGRSITGYSMIRSAVFAVAAIGGLLFSDSASAQTATPTQGIQPLSTNTSLTPNRDVILEIPEISVDSIGLTVENVKAHVALDANAMNFVQLTAGVDVGIKKVQLGIVGVFGEAYLYVDLDNVAKIVNRVVQTLDRNPQILTQVLKTVDTAVTSVTGVPAVSK